MATKDLYSANNFHRMSFGDFGFRILNHSDEILTTPVGEYYCMIECIVSATISLTNDAPAGDTTIINYDVLDGQIIYGNFTNVTISKGHIICYLRHVP